MATSKPQPAPEEPEYFHLQVDTVGRVVIPAELRERLGFKPGAKVSLRTCPGTEEISLISQEAAWRAAQAYFSQFRKPGDPSIVDELIAERRAEAAREYGYRPPAAKPRSRSRRVRAR